MVWSPAAMPNEAVGICHTVDGRSTTAPLNVAKGLLSGTTCTCNVPAATHLGVCVAIKHGQVNAATVIARPANASLEACVKARTRALQFPYSNRIDIARTQF